MCLLLALLVCLSQLLVIEIIPTANYSRYLALLFLLKKLNSLISLFQEQVIFLPAV